MASFMFKFKLPLRKYYLVASILIQRERIALFGCPFFGGEMRKKILILLSLSTLLLFTACKPTPVVTAVINKNEGVLEEKINEDYAGEIEKKTPEHIEEDIYSSPGQYSILVNADVEQPTQAAFSVYSIVPDDFTQDEIDKFISYFFGDKPLYAENTILTKEMIQERVVTIKAEMETMDDNSDDLAGAQAALKQLEEQYKTAPTTVTQTEITSKLSIPPDADFEMLDAYVDSGYNKMSSFSVYNQRNRQSLYINIDLDRIFLGLTELAGKQAANQTMTIETAKEHAINILDEMGIENIVPVNVETGMTEDQSKQGYIVTFRQSVNGTPIALNQILNYSDSQDMSVKWSSDELRVILDDEGVSALYWIDKGKILNELNSNIELLAFNDIYDIAKQQLKNKYSWIDTSDYNINYERTVHVDRIVLEYTCAQEKDKPGYYLLVPAWNFYGGNTLKFENGQTEEEQGLRKDICVLSLNAVDGSVIGG